MEILWSIAGSFILALIITILRYIFGGKRSPGDSTFTQKFISTFFVLLIILVIGAVLNMAGWNSENEPNYPMKYSPD